uniref:AMP-binding domain-containing protein n=1 Tax=Panagrellus redivivus TaxID=6233 RepID=A0A7E4W999_PANRE
MPLFSSDWPEMPLEEPTDTTFTEYFFKSVTRYADLVALIDPDRRESVTFDELRCRTGLVIRALSEIGVRKGHNIGTFVGNSIEYLVFFLAANQIGAILVPLNPAYKLQEFEHYFTQAKADWILTENEYASKVRESQKLMDRISSLIVLPCRDDALLLKSFTNTKYLEDEPHPNPNTKNFIWQDSYTMSTDPAVIFFSSGTTGPPKGVVLSQRALCAHIAIANHFRASSNLDDGDFVTLTNKDTVYGCLPFFHAGGLLTVFVMLAQGAKVMINRRFDEDVFIQNIDEYQVTVLNLVPPLLEFLAQSPKADPTLLTSLKYIYVGAAKVRPDLEDIISQKFPNVEQVLQLYGSTEAGVLVFMMPRKLKFDLLSPKVGSCGIPLPGVEPRILPSPSLETSSHFRFGELLLKTATMMTSYIDGGNNAAESPFDKDGFLHTGDIVRLDSDGFFYIAGRTKELIKVRGWQVSPYELEEALKKRFASILDIAVIGIPDEKLDEQPSAVIVLAPGRMLSGGEVEMYIEDNFVSYKHLKGGVQFVDSLPRTPSGKLDRPAILAMLTTESSTESEAETESEVKL